MTIGWLAVSVLAVCLTVLVLNRWAGERQAIANDRATRCAHGREKWKRCERCNDDAVADLRREVDADRAKRMEGTVLAKAANPPLVIRPGEVLGVSAVTGDPNLPVLARIERNPEVPKPKYSIGQKVFEVDEEDDELAELCVVERRWRGGVWQYLCMSPDDPRRESLSGLTLVYPDRDTYTEPELETAADRTAGAEVAVLDEPRYRSAPPWDPAMPLWLREEWRSVFPKWAARSMSFIREEDGYTWVQQTDETGYRMTARFRSDKLTQVRRFGWIVDPEQAEVTTPGPSTVWSGPRQLYHEGDRVRLKKEVQDEKGGPVCELIVLALVQDDEEGRFYELAAAAAPPMWYNATKDHLRFTYKESDLEKVRHPDIPKFSAGDEVRHRNQAGTLTVQLSKRRDSGWWVTCEESGGGIQVWHERDLEKA